MTQPMHKWIKSVIDTTQGLTQKGLAEAMDLNPAAVNRMLHGARGIKVSEIPVIESYLGQKWQSQNDVIERKFHPMGGSSDVYGAAQPVRGVGAPMFDQTVVPVYGHQDRAQNVSMNQDKPVDWVSRHPLQAGLDGAFAFYIFSDDMQPRYFPGELIYLHPGRPAEQNRDCLIKFKDGQAVVRTFLHRDGGNVVVRQYNLPQDTTISTKDIEQIYMVLGRN